MTLPRWLSLVLAWTLLLQSLAPALATPPSLPREHTNRIGMDRQTLGTVGMGYGVTGVEHHQYLVDTSQPYAEVIQEAELMNNALPLITRYDIGLDRLRMFKSQMTSNGPPPVYSPVLSGWYLFDGLGSTRAVVDDSGVGQSEFGYGDAFGIPYQVAANGTRTTAGAGFFLNGQQWDGGASFNGSPAWNSGEGLYFNRARYYQAGLGRFIGEDSVLGKAYEPVTLHRYLYAINEPINNTDPSGKMALISMSLGSTISVGSRPSGEGWKFSISQFAIRKLLMAMATAAITAITITIPGYTDPRIENRLALGRFNIFNKFDVTEMIELSAYGK